MDKWKVCANCGHDATNFVTKNRESTYLHLYHWHKTEGDVE